MQALITLKLMPGLASTVRRTLQALAGRRAGVHTAWRRRRQVRATAQAQGLLDDHLLRDLALGRSEVLSAAAELHGQTQRERRHAGPGASAPR